MNHRLFLRVTAPALAVGLLLFGACFAGIRYINRLETNLTTVLSDNVASAQAAQELEISVRQLRYHSILYLTQPVEARLTPIETDQRRFLEALELVDQAATDDERRDCVHAIRSGYDQYQKEQATLRTELIAGMAAGRTHLQVIPAQLVTSLAQPSVAAGMTELLRLQDFFDASALGMSTHDLHKISDSHPIRLIVTPCKELIRINKVKMAQLALDSRGVSREGSLAMLILGLTGSVGGLVVGYGVARSLKQSIYRLSVHVQDMAHQLDKEVGTVDVAADGDFTGLDRQMQYIVHKLEAVAGKLQQQQRELLRAEQLSAVGQLAAGVAHEIRNPLTGIKMLVEASLRQQNPRPLDGDDVRVIHGEVVRLEQKVQSFLNFARLPAPQRSPCDLRAVIQQACDLVRGRADQQRVEVAIHAPDRPVIAPVDRGQLGTVLVNLFLNALDAMPGGGRLDVSLDLPAEGVVRLAVADTGTGIPEKALGRLFTPFVTTKPTGTGLGLSLSARILEEHGGTIHGENRPEGGARFVFTLPAPQTEVSRDDAAGR